MKAEILAPVGGIEQLKAAVNAGADAVYFGLPDFNARRNAKNFSREEFFDAVAYAHIYGVKAHITLNTIIRDREIDNAAKAIEDAAKAGADALIVQDMAVLKMAKNICPELPLHASTQMAVHNREGVIAAKELGFERAVLARELSLDEIKMLTNEGIEIEAFVHGALCMSASGMCYLSSVLGGRSGNRGLCAQPCRLDFRCDGRDHVLSLKDMSHLAYAREMADAGVCSFKIEGRMKGPEYVACAVSSLKAALNGEEWDEELLQSAFSRSGFTDGYISGRRKDMFGVRGEDDKAATKKASDRFSTVLAQERKITADMFFYAAMGEKTTLTVTDGEHYYTAEAAAAERSKNMGLSKDRIAAALSKTGGTPFATGNISADIGENVWLAASTVNALRRDALEGLAAMRAKPAEREIREYTGISEIPYRTGTPKLRVRATDITQIAKGADEYVLPIDEILSNPKFVSDNIICELPRLVYPKDEAALEEKLNKASEIGARKVMAENIGAFMLAKRMGFDVYCGAGLNVINSLAMQKYEELGARDITLSYECSAKDMSRLSGKVSRSVIVYGYQPLMHFRACPIGAGNCKNCSGEGVLTDRKGKSFCVRCENRRYSVMYNSVPLYVLDKLPEAVDIYTLYFTNETADEAKDILRKYKEKTPAEGEFTRGLYYRELL